MWSSEDTTTHGLGLAHGGAARTRGAVGIAMSFTMVGGGVLGASAARMGERALRDASRFGGHAEGARLGVCLGRLSMVLSALWIAGLAGVLIGS